MPDEALAAPAEEAPEGDEIDAGAPFEGDRAADAASSPQAQSDLAKWSVGSENHAEGTCKPCAFLHTKGCENGADCQFCHMCDVGEKKKRRKERVRKAAEARELEEAQAASAAAAQPQQPILLATTCPNPPQALGPQWQEAIERIHAQRAMASLAMPMPPAHLLPPASWLPREAPVPGVGGAPGLSAPPGMPSPLDATRAALLEQQAAVEQQMAWAWAQEAALAASAAAQLPPLAELSADPSAASGDALAVTPVCSPEKVASPIPVHEEASPTPFEKLVSMVEAGGAREAKPSETSPQPLTKISEAATPQKVRAQGPRYARSRGKDAENCPPQGNAAPKPIGAK